MYSIYAAGKAGQVTGLYLNGVLLFQAKIVGRPFESDTTANVKLSIGTSYTFCIKPNRRLKDFTFFTANGANLQTSTVSGRYPAKGGRYFCRVKINRKYNGLIGVYCRVDGTVYLVFFVGCK